MPRKAASTEVEIGEVGDVETPDKTSEPKNPGPEFVTREEHDSAVRSLRDEISSLKETVADLEAVVTAPEGSVRFARVESPDVQRQWNDSAGSEHVPEYSRSQPGDGGIPWY